MRHCLTIFLLLGCLLLTGCGSDAQSSGALQEKILDDFTISIPSTWPLVSKDSDGVPTPSSGEIVLIASAETPQKGFANNIVILEKLTSRDTNSQAYALASETGIEDEFYSYSEKESGDMEFLDKEISHYSVFTAQYNKNTPKVNYIQTARVCGIKAFTITVAVGKEITNFARYKELISTFSCKV